jgi:hypothetical protein
MEPIRFVFGLHLHQPVGNFDHVFAQHVEDVYRPLLDRLAGRGFLPVVLHLSGPLLEWLEQHERGYLDRIGALAADGKLEILLAGYYEPVLAALPRADRVEQVRWMHEAVQRRFGVDARGLWLTERVWEPELAADLADAGVRFALVDDRHFLATGFPAERLHAPFWTESDGRRVALFPIDERLRYLIPFRAPEETADYLRGLRAAGHRLAVLADDGEKFGGWPGTKEWVYERGWLDRFMDVIGGLVERGEAALSRLDEALEQVPSNGIAYLPTASYTEMESWSLPPDAALRLARLRRDLGPERMAGPDGALVRGAHWRNFLVKYPESNRMHKKMQALSALCRRRGNPPEARRAIGRAQCNDAYWHGVFGGLYLPHLRDAVWRELARAEGELRRGKGLAWEILDFDGDGQVEIWIHSESFSALVSPVRGAAVEEYTVFAKGINFANVLTRRREACRGGGGRWWRRGREHPRDRRGRAARRPSAARRRWSGAAGRAYAPGIARAGGVRRRGLPAGALVGAGALPLRGAAAARRAGDRLCSGGARHPAGQADPLRYRRRDDGALCLGPGRRARRRLYHRALSRRVSPSGGHTHSGDLAVSDRDGRQIRARSRSHAAG